MATTTQMKNMNEYFAAFISKVVEDYEWSDDEHDALMNAWNDEENQKKLAQIIKTPKAKTTKTSEKKAKDPNKPKRGKSAYLFFCEEERPKVKKSLGDGVKTTEVTKELGARWKLLTASTNKADKKRVADFEAKAAEDKQRYEDEMSNYEAPSDEELEQKEAEKKAKKTGGKKGSGKSSGKKKDKDAPKRPKSAYLFFCQDKRPDVKESLGDDAKPSDVTARLGEMWNELKTDEDREEELAQYTQQATDDKKRYEDEMADYVPSDESEDEKTEKTEKPKKTSDKKTSDKKTSDKKTSDKKTSDKKTSGKKKYNAYTFYASLERPCVKEEFPDMTATEVTKELARRWKQISEESKEAWKQRAAEANE